MQQVTYEFLPGSEHARKTTAAWLKLGLFSLVFAGIFSILLVLARTPVVQGFIPFINFFQVALVVHVTLSVLIWLLCISAAMWSTSCTGDMRLWDRASFTLAALGTGIIVVAPFVGAGNPQMSNYVPVLQHPLFFAGLISFVLGISSHLVRTLISRPPVADHLTGSAALKVGVTITAAVTGAAFICVLASYTGIPRDMGGQIYFEFLFWGGGHLIQFSYTALMMVCWVVLVYASGCKFELTPRLTLVFLVFLILPIIVVPFLYLAHDVTSPGHRLGFTELMKYGGLSCLPLGLAVAASIFKRDKASTEGRYLHAALISSLVLFAAGGVLGFMISGLDIVIPAHYHGATVGVTIAFMGLVYYLLPGLGYRQPDARMAFWQPLLYGAGQLMHIIGLAWTGGYGVQRKTAGLAQGVDRVGEIAGMGLMGLGGLISIIGGLLFLIVTYKAMRGGRRTNADQV